MRCSGNLDMSAPVSAMNTCAVLTPYPGHGLQQLELVADRGDLRGLGVTGRQGRLDLTETFKHPADQQRVVVIVAGSLEYARSAITAGSCSPATNAPSIARTPSLPGPPPGSWR